MVVDGWVVGDCAVSKSMSASVLRSVLRVEEVVDQTDEALVLLDLHPMATSSKDMQLRGLDQLVQAQRRFTGNHAVVTAMQDQRFMQDRPDVLIGARSEETTSDLQSLMRNPS